LLKPIVILNFKSEPIKFDNYYKTKIENRGYDSYEEATYSFFKEISALQGYFIGFLSEDHAHHFIYLICLVYTINTNK
jgi:hypothetical protein